MVMPEMPRIIKIFICHNNSLMVQTQTHRYEGAKVVRSPGSGEYIYRVAEVCGRHSHKCTSYSGFHKINAKCCANDDERKIASGLKRTRRYTLINYRSL